MLLARWLLVDPALRRHSTIAVECSRRRSLKALVVYGLLHRLLALVVLESWALYGTHHRGESA